MFSLFFENAFETCFLFDKLLTGTIGPPYPSPLSHTQPAELFLQRSVLHMEQSLAYIRGQLTAVMGIDSPSGCTDNIQQYLLDTLTAMGYTPSLLRKGGVHVTLGGQGNPLTLMAHADTLGAVVRRVKPNGRLAISNISLNVFNVEGENVHIITRNGSVYEGTLQLCNASIHVNPDPYQARDLNKNMEIVLDYDVSTQEAVTAMGIRPGDVIALDPRLRITDTGYVKSRFLDDKASVTALLTLANWYSTRRAALPRRVDLLFTVFEEVGHGGACGIADDTEELIAVDMGCVGDDLNCTERQVSICAKDNSGLYNRQVTNKLLRCAQEAGVDYALDIYPSYSSDASVAIRTGHDVRHGLIGPGVYASHGYERTHLDGIYNTFALLRAYIEGGEA